MNGLTADEHLEELGRRLQFDQLLAAMVQRLGSRVLDAGLPESIRREVTGLAEELGFDRCVLLAVRENVARVVVRCECDIAQLELLPDSLCRERDVWLFEAVERAGFVKTTAAGWVRCVISMAASTFGAEVYLLLVECRQQSPGCAFLQVDTLRLLCELLGGMLRHSSDVADAQTLRVKLVQADRVARLGQLTATLAHELNQPLAAMLCNAQAAERMLAQAAPDVKEARAALADIVVAARHADAVIQQTRTLFRKGSVLRHPVDLNVLVTQVLSAFRWESVQVNADVNVDLGAGLPPVLGNEIQLQQVVRNLLGNACEAVKDNPADQRRITVTTRWNACEGFELCVRDSGVGIPEGMEDTIFTPFYTNKDDGLGMGLPICRQIVEGHGGVIRAEGLPEGGALFRITLPSES